MCSSDLQLSIMPTSKVQPYHAGDGALPRPPMKMPEGLKTKVVAPRNPKLVGWEDRPRKVRRCQFTSSQLHVTFLAEVRKSWGEWGGRNLGDPTL